MHKRPRNEWCYKPNHKRYGRDRAVSRFSPEGSPRGHRMHNSEHRNYNRGRSHLRSRHSDQFQPTMPARSKNDILMEAGRLAAEYLVSVGKLPTDTLSNCQNYDVKTQMGKSEGFERSKVENEQTRKDGRGSARSHSFDVEPDRRRYSDENRSTRSKKSEKWGRSESSRDCRPERNRELSRSRSWATWRRSSPSRDSDYNGPTIGKDGNGGGQSSSHGEITEGGRSAYLESGWESWGSIEKESTQAEYVSEKQGRNDGDFNQIDDKIEEINTYGRKENVGLFNYNKYGNGRNKLMTDPNTDQYTMNAGDAISEREFSESYAPGFIVHNFMSTVPSHQARELRNANSDRGMKQEIDHGTDGWESFSRSREAVHNIDDQCQLTLGGIFDLNEDHTIANLPPIAVTGKEATTTDFGLSMQSNSNPLNFKRGVKDDDIVYIYSEDEDDKSFSNRGKSANQIPSVQDGYERKMSKIVRNDSPTSSSVTRDLIS